MLGQFTRFDEAKQIVVDIETKDRFLKTKGASWVFKDGYILGIAIKIDEQPSEYYPLAHLYEPNYDRGQVSKYVADIFMSNIPILGHFLYYDVGWIAYDLFSGAVPHGTKYRDTLLEAQLYRNDLASHSLDAISQHFKVGAKINIPGEDIWKKPIFQVEPYACNDADLTNYIDKKMYPEINHQALDRESKLINILVEMKRRGIKIDEEQLEVLRNEWQREYYSIVSGLPVKDIWKADSLVRLFNYLRLPIDRTSIGNPSFTKGYLESINHPVIKDLVKARELYRLVNTFIKGVRGHLEDSVIHPDYFNGRSEFGGTLLGRFSSAHPNVQQVPQRSQEGLRIKAIFIPHKSGNLWTRFDYKQQEPLLSMHYANRLNVHGIKDWIAEYLDSDDPDCYIPVMNRIGCSRHDAKTNWLAVSYGMGPQHMAEINGMSMSVAVEQLREFHEAVPWIRPMIDRCIKKIESFGFIKTIGDRRLYFNPAFAYRGMNGLVQGSASDQIKVAMINLYEKYNLIPLSQVHDELNYEMTEDNYIQGYDKAIVDEMKNAYELDIPVRVDSKFGYTWKDCCEK